MGRQHLGSNRFWVFDLDGTLTQPIFDFPNIKRRLGLPSDRGILEQMEHMSPQRAEVIARELEQIEWEYAGRAQPAPGAALFLEKLAERGDTLGVLTRNKRSHALETLAVIGMSSYFEDDHVLGRDEARHKPDPDGLLQLLGNWCADRTESVMIGDFLFDLQAGKAAEMTAIYVDPKGNFPHRDWADLCVMRLDQIPLE